MGASEALTLRGRVIRMNLDENLGPDGPYSAGVLFEEVSPEARQELEWLLEERAQGPAMLRPAGEREAEPPLNDPEITSEEGPRAPLDVEVDVTVSPEAEAKPEPQSAPPRAPAPKRSLKQERRQHRRASYERKVPAFGTRALRVLVARDLSQGGMRVERFSGLEVGDRLHLAIYGAAEHEPFLVWATVHRDDGPQGLALVFDPVSPKLAEQLEKVVADLPAVESLHDDETRAMGTVVTEILRS
jgi:hypothetical protein